MKFHGVLCAVSIAGVASHGYIDSPASRNKLHCNDEFICLTDRETPNACDNLGCSCYNGQCTAGYLPGRATPKEPVCGAGDSNPIFTTPGDVQANWKAGETVSITWVVAANHAGNYQYRLCLDGSDNEACFQRLPLKFDDGSDWKWLDHGNDAPRTDRVVIPADVTCERCTLGWRWDGALESSIFTNCADVSISGTAPAPAPTPIPVPTPTPSPQPSPSGCPGGSLSACMALCPSEPTAFEVCVEACVARCGDAPTPRPMPAPAPAPTPFASCTTYENADCYGDDVSPDHHYRVDSPSDCCHLCGGDESCSAWTFSQYDGAGQLNPTCYLKAGCSSRQYCGTCTAGTVDKAVRVEV